MASAGGRALPPLQYLLEPRKGSTGAWMRHRIWVGRGMVPALRGRRVGITLWWFAEPYPHSGGRGGGTALGRGLGLGWLWWFAEPYPHSGRE